jgi:hypothetical protein
LARMRHACAQFAPLIKSFPKWKKDYWPFRDPCSYKPQAMLRLHGYQIQVLSRQGYPANVWFFMPYEMLKKKSIKQYLSLSKIREWKRIIHINSFKMSSLMKKNISFVCRWY